MSRKAIMSAREAAFALFMRIEEPRIVRVFHFVIYSLLAVAGSGFVFSQPPVVQSVLGVTLSTVLGCSVLLGGLIGLVSIIPGVWWAERLAIILLVCGLLMYLVAVMGLGVSPIAIGIIASLILSLSLRWIEVRRYQHAPGK